jgi:hypothetical protein
LIRALGRAVGRWLAGALVVGAVFFGPNGVDPHDVVHHLRGSVLVLLVVAAIATAWIAPAVRAATIAPGTDLVRALPYRRGVLAGALFVGVLAATLPFGVLVVAGGGPGLAFAIALVAMIAALQPRAPAARPVFSGALALGRIVFAAGSVVMSFRAPLSTIALAGPFGAWTLAASFAEARAPRGSPWRLVPPGAPPALVVPWSVVVEAARADGGSFLRAGATVAGAALVARAAAPHAASALVPAVVAAVAAAALAAPSLVAGFARAAEAHRALHVVPDAVVLARRALALVSAAPLFAFALALGAAPAALLAAATFGGLAAALASFPVLVRRDALPVAAAVLAVAEGGTVFVAPWGPVALSGVLVGASFVVERRRGTHA